MPGILQRLEAKLRADGFGVMVAEPEAAESWPLHAYTIGLAVQGHPELYVVGLPMQEAAPLLHVLATRVIRGERFDTKIWDERSTPGVALAFVAIAKPPFPLHGIELISPELELDFLQVLYTGPDGRFPWERRASDPGRAEQAYTLPSLRKH